MACTDMAIRLEVDGLATGSSASTKSRSLELLLVLHTLLGAAVLQRTTGGSTPSSSTLRYAVAVRAVQPHVVWQCTAEAAVSAAAGPSRRRGPRACVDLHPYPVPGTPTAVVPQLQRSAILIPSVRI